AEVSERQKIEQLQRTTEQQRMRAERNERLALGALEDLHLPLVERQALNQDDKRNQQELALLTRTQAYYEQFVRENRGDPEVRQHPGRACQRIPLSRRIQGQHSEAGQAHEQAAQVHRELAEAFPDRPDSRHALALNYNTLSGSLHRLHRSADAVAAHRQAVALARQLIAEFPQSAEYH